MVFLREFIDEVVGQSGLGRVHNALTGNLAQTVTDVVPHRVVKQNIFLRDDGDLFAQGTDGDAGNVHSIDADHARGAFVKARQ